MTLTKFRKNFKKAIEKQYNGRKLKQKHLIALNYVDEVTRTSSHTNTEQIIVHAYDNYLVDLKF